MLRPHLSAHGDVDQKVVHRAGLGQKGGNDGERRCDDLLFAEGLQHGHDCIGCPADKEAGYHQQKHGRHLFLITKDFNYLSCLKVLDRLKLQ